MSSNASIIQRRSLHEELAERLRDMIADGSLPPGQRISEKALCERFAVSRTPLREALKVLAAEDIVVLRPNRGAAVKSLTHEELEELFPVIGALEALAGEIACAKITDAEVEKINVLHVAMENAWQAGRLQAYFRLNRLIHEAIIDATGNEVLKSTYNGLSARLPNLRYVAGMSPQRWERAVDEHRAIVAALVERDGTALARVMRTHLRTKLDTVKEWLVRFQENEADPGRHAEAQDDAAAEYQIE